MRRRNKRVGRNEVIELKKVAAKLWRKKDHGEKQNTEACKANDIVDGVVRVEGDAIKRNAVAVFLGLNFYAIGVV